MLLWLDLLDVIVAIGVFDDKKLAVPAFVVFHGRVVQDRAV